MHEPPTDTISKWEHGVRAPEAEYRMALARIAGKQKATEDLVPIFLAPTATWRVVSRLAAIEDE